MSMDDRALKESILAMQSACSLIEHAQFTADFSAEESRERMQEVADKARELTDLLFKAQVLGSETCPGGYDRALQEVTKEQNAAKPKIPTPAPDACRGLDRLRIGMMTIGSSMDHDMVSATSWLRQVLFNLNFKG